MPPPWLAPLTRALDAGVAVSPAARFLQVATVRPDGRPAVRTVVFRGWFEGGARGGPRLGFVTDARYEDGDKEFEVGKGGGGGKRCMN